MNHRVVGTVHCGQCRGCLLQGGSAGYAFLVWLAPAYVARGWSAAAGGALLAVNSLAQLLAAVVMPVLAGRLSEPSAAVVGAVAVPALGCAWLLTMPDVLPWAGVAVAGIGLGGRFSLALILVADFAPHPLAAGRLAALVFLVGYTVAAIAPVLIGAIHDVTGAFTVPSALLIAMAVLQLWLGRRLGPGATGQRWLTPADAHLPSRHRLGRPSGSIWHRSSCVGDGKCRTWVLRLGPPRTSRDDDGLVR